MLNSLYHIQRFLVRAYKYLHGYDKYEINYVRKSLNPGDIAIDIGAHKGAYAYWMRHSVKKSGKIIVIEPQPILFQYLKKMVRIAGYGNVALMDCAVSDEDKEGVITVPGKLGQTSQCARMDDEKIIQNKREYHKVNVKVRSVDSIIAETKIKPKLIKIDVEGHEMSVIKGMGNTLKEIRPRIILECEERHIEKGVSVFEVFEILLDQEYEGFYFQDGKRKPLSVFDIERDQTNHLRGQKKPDLDYVANFIFEPND